MKKQTVKNQDLFLGFTLILMNHMRKCGYKITYGDAYRDPRATFPYSQPWSYHAKRLAIDLNLFHDFKTPVIEVPEWEKVGDFWLSLDSRCTWGGAFDGGKSGDFNHFSFLEGI